jgi:hypothetical protein
VNQPKTRHLSGRPANPPRTGLDKDRTLKAQSWGLSMSTGHPLLQRISLETELSPLGRSESSEIARLDRFRLGQLPHYQEIEPPVRDISSESLPLS